MNWRKNFFQGLLLLVPVVVTIYVVFFVFTAIDGWLSIPVPGLGFFFTIGIIILVGRLTTNVFVQGALQSLDNVLGKTPFVKLLYTSIKDLIEAFMGEKKRFDQPVMVNLVSSGHTKAIGFVTRRSLEFLGLEDHVAVYFPQSYNFAGNLLVFPGTHVQPLSLESSEVMAFIVVWRNFRRIFGPYFFGVLECRVSPVSLSASSEWTGGAHSAYGYIFELNKLCEIYSSAVLEVGIAFLSEIMRFPVVTGSSRLCLVQRHKS